MDLLQIYIVAGKQEGIVDCKNKTAVVAHSEPAEGDMGIFAKLLPIDRSREQGGLFFLQVLTNFLWI